jgi:hypothetical protein
MGLSALHRHSNFGSVVFDNALFNLQMNFLVSYDTKVVNAAVDVDGSIARADPPWSSTNSVYIVNSPKMIDIA